MSGVGSTTALTAGEDHGQDLPSSRKNAAQFGTGFPCLPLPKAEGKPAPAPALLAAPARPGSFCGAASEKMFQGGQKIPRTGTCQADVLI